MTFSFTSPSPKPIFTPVTHSWIICFLASFGVVFIIWMLLGEQSKDLTQQSKAIDVEINQQGIVKSNLQSKLDHLNRQIQEISIIKADNTALLQGVENLFGLIPDQITIDSISLSDDLLTLKGITPSKELYIFLLETPLRAIFSQSNVEFYVLPSGWYNFVSVSKIIKPQGELNGE